MSYIGNQSQTAYSALVKQDITGNNGTSYTLSHPVSNENDILLYINNVKQEGGSGKAFTASGTTLTLSEAIASSDSCYVQYIGLAIQTVTPPDGSVGTSKLADGAVNLTSKVTGVLPVANGGTGISTVMADQFRLTGTTNDGSNADVTSNIERIHTTGQGTLGTGMTESSGIFSFPSTGIYLVMFNVDFTIGGSENNAFCNLNVTTNNSSYTVVASANSGSQDGSHGASGTGVSLVDVTNTSNVKVKFSTSSMNSGSSLIGSEDQNRTTFTFIKLGG
jgi:hypothetical protein